LGVKVFQNKTVFVVGAGASKDIGFPLGVDLKDKIKSLIDIRFKFGQYESGSQSIIYALTSIQRDINPYTRAGRALAEALRASTVKSIDAYLDTHKDNADIVLMGKLGIADAILSAEAISELKFNLSDGHRNPAIAVALRWYADFAELLLAGAQPQDLNTIFQNLSIINFNYDRCIEHYLSYALPLHFVMQREEVLPALANLNIIHPYGRVGALDWEQANDSVVNAFGETPIGDKLIKTANEIQTFTEQMKDKELIAKIRKTMSEAHTIVFLGFGFLEQNMRLLTVDSVSNAQRVFATRANIQDDDWQDVRSAITSMLKKDSASCPKIRTAKYCKELFVEQAYGLRTS
jgi:hypothetical protein